MDGRALRHALVGVDVVRRALPRKALHVLLNGGDARRAAHEQHAAQFAGGDARVVERLLHGPRRCLHEVARDLVERGACDGFLQVQRAGRPLREEGKVHGGRLHRRQLALGGLRRLAHAGRRHLVAAEVDAGLALERGKQVVGQARVEVVAAEVVVACGGEHLDHVVADLDDGHVERAAAEVVHHDHLRVAVVEPVGERRRCGLVDDAQDVEPRDGAGVLGGLALHVVEIRGHGDDRVGDALVQVALGVLAQLAQDHGGKLLRRECLAVDVRAPIGSHVALHRADGALRVHGGLALRHRAHEAFALFGERDD